MNLLFTAVVCGTLVPTNAPPRTDPVTNSERAERFHHAMVLFSEIHNDRGLAGLSVDNSQVLIESRSVGGYVARGTKVIPVVLELMEIEDISFDTFIRCYSICDQILTKAGKKPVWWQGGATTDKAGRLIPSGQKNVPEFRSLVIQDIRKKLAQVQRNSDD
jgi:hypothetical protein